MATHRRSSSQPLPLRDGALNYANAKILAPMVRCGTLPLRLFALEQGADIVYGEELIALRVKRATRVVDHERGFVDLVDHQNRNIFRTCEKERGRLVFQLGVGAAPEAIEAGAIAASVGASCVDLNMGCPKKFSVSGGMGAELLKDPERAEDILKSLRRTLPGDVGVSCKIRLLDTEAKTAELARRLEATGIDALTVHCRSVDDRPRHAARWDDMRAVRDAVRCPLVVNGDVMTYADFERSRQATGADAAMCARAAMWDPSVFNAKGPLSHEACLRRYAQLCVETDNLLPNTKFVMKEMLMGGGTKYGVAPKGTLEGAVGKALNKAKTLRAMCDAVGVDAAWHDTWRTSSSGGSGDGGGASGSGDGGEGEGEGDDARGVKRSAAPEAQCDIEDMPPQRKPRPEEPGPNDCCGNGCANCCWTEHQEAVDAWERNEDDCDKAEGK